MAFDAEKEITKLWGDLHAAQSEIGRTYFRWRQAALAVAGPKANPLEVSLKAAEIIGKELGKAVPAAAQLPERGRGVAQEPGRRHGNAMDYAGRHREDRQGGETL